MKLIKGCIFALIMMVGGAAYAVPMPDFIVYGNASADTKVAAYWNDAKISDSTFNKGYYRLAISMDSDNPYHSGDVVELWKNGEPTGTMVTIGGMGTVKRLDLAE